MADALSRAKLARAAAQLNAGLSLVLMSEDARDLLAAANLLPPQALIVLRARAAQRRAELAKTLVPGPHPVLIAGDAKLASLCGAAGLHLPEARAHESPHWRAKFPHWIITVAAHSLGAVMRAQQFRADAIFLSPIFATASHPGRAPLGAVRAAFIAAQSRLPVYALGGIDARNAAALSGTPFCGLAAISALD